MTRRFLMAIVGAAFMFAIPAAALAQNFGGYGGGGSYASGGGGGCASNPQFAQLMQEREDLNNQISQADYYHDYSSAHELASQLDSVNQQIGQLGPNGCSSTGSGYSQNQPSSGPYGSPQQYMAQGNGGASQGYGAPQGYGAQGYGAANGAGQSPSGAGSLLGALMGGQNGATGAAPGTNANGAAGSPLTSMLGPLLQGFMH
ncbi:MAG TPA: hypothetical protein VMA09_16895 [Candidatus Binataceae bacterium]|nr:hypothetical protein [Candidatus Binataceae bacterium]